MAAARVAQQAPHLVQGIGSLEQFHGLAPSAPAGAVPERMRHPGRWYTAPPGGWPSGCTLEYLVSRMAWA